MMNTFLNKMLIVFFCLVNPISKKHLILNLRGLRLAGYLIQQFNKKKQ